MRNLLLVAGLVIVLSILVPGAAGALEPGITCPRAAGIRMAAGPVDTANPAGPPEAASPADPAGSPGMVRRPRAQAGEAPVLAAADVPAILERLQSSDAQVRLTATQEIQQVQPASAALDAVPFLIALIDRKDPSDPLVQANRRLAVETLGRLPLTPEGTRALFAALTDPDQDLRYAAAQAVPILPEQVPQLVAALANPDPAVRSSLIGRFRQFGNPPREILEAVVARAEDPDPQVRRQVGMVLAEVGKGYAAAGPALAQAMSREKDEFTCTFLARAWLATGGARSQDLSLLQGLLRRAGDHSLRYTSAGIIGSLQADAASAVPDLCQALEKDPDPMVRGCAAEALGAIGPAARPALPILITRATARSGDDYRYLAVQALGKIATVRDLPTVEALLALLDDTSPDVQKEALVALRLLKPAPVKVRERLIKARIQRNSVAGEAFAAIADDFGLTEAEREAVFRRATEDPRQTPLSRLTDPDRFVRQSTLDVLRRTGETDPALVPGLIPNVRDAEPLNRWAAAEILGRIGSAAHQAVPELVAVIREENAKDGGYAARALIKIAPAHPEVLAALRDRLLRGEFGADQFAQALAASGRAGVPALIAALESESPEAIYAAAGALADLGPEAVDAIPALVRLTGDQRLLTIRRTDGAGTSLSRVVRALKAIGPDDGRVKEALKKLPELPSDL